MTGGARWPTAHQAIMAGQSPEIPGPPPETFDQKLERMQADGTITIDDADTAREFAEFLRKLGPKSDDSPEAIARRRRALIEHAELCGLTTADVERLKGAEGGEHG